MIPGGDRSDVFFGNLRSRRGWADVLEQRPKGPTGPGGRGFCGRHSHGQRHGRHYTCSRPHRLLPKRREGPAAVRQVPIRSAERTSSQRQVKVSRSDPGLGQSGLEQPSARRQSGDANERYRKGYTTTPARPETPIEVVTTGGSILSERPFRELTMFYCPADMVKWMVCDHMSCPELFIESVLTQSPLRAYPCANMEDFSRGRCTQCSGGQCPSMGYDADKTRRRASGKHFLYTNKSPPYSGSIYQ